MTTLDLNRLPYELWASIFSHFDRQTSLDACLASQLLNELASRPLYSSIVVNPHAKEFHSRGSQIKQPFFALERRPHLRKAVLEVEIYFTSRDYAQHKWEMRGGLREWQDCSQAMKLLPCVTTAHIKPWIDESLMSYQGYEFKPIYEAIAALPSVHRLNVSTVFHPSETLTRISEIYLETDIYLGEHLEMWNFTKCVKKLNLRSANGGVLYGSLPWISIFGNLIDLSVLVQAEALQVEVYVALRKMPFLQRLRLDELPNILSTKHRPYGSAKLKRLQTLSITFSHQAEWSPELRSSTDLVDLLEYLAGRSPLTHLTVQVTRQQYVESRCRHWLPQILRKHKGTLRELMIPQFQTDAESARLIFTQCPALEQLKMALDPGVRSLLPELVPSSRNLVVLQIYLSHNKDKWTFADSETLIHDSVYLREVNICITDNLAQYRSNPEIFKPSWLTNNLAQYRRDTEVFKTSWIAEWHYDSASDSAIRRVRGPEESSYPPSEWQKR